MLKNKKRTASAFSLIEAAIVLGIVGLVIGGLWTAAASVTEKQRLNSYSNGMITIVTGMRHLFGGNNFNNSDQWLSLTAIEAGLIPKDWITNGSGGIRSPSGRQIDVGILYDPTELAISSGNGFYVNWYDLTDKECIGLAGNINTRMKGQSDLVYMAIGSATFLRSFPANMATISANCLARGGNLSVLFAFQP